MGHYTKFFYVKVDYVGLNSKGKIAYKSGWLCLGRFGWSTLVCVKIINEFGIQKIIHKLAEYIFRKFKAPNMLDELDAARHEVNNMSVLCAHPTRTLLAIDRECGNIGIKEQVGKIQNPMMKITLAYGK
jgi:hypothetical protein